MTTVYANGGTMVNHHYARWSRENSVEDCTRAEVYEEDDDGQQRRLTPLEKLSHEMAHDERAVKEVTLGKRIGFYRIRGEIGSGNFSQVKLGVHLLTKEKVAIKILDKTKLDQKTQRLLSREISSMERLHHPNIIRLYEVIETPSKLHLVMEYAGGGELFTKISTEGRLSEVDSKIIFAQIVAAVKHMHENDTVHRDLKAENVFYVTAGRVKVGDFGFSTACRRDQMLSTCCGSPPYAAPELFGDQSYAGALVDVWALGVLLYFMVAGGLPFRADTVAGLRRRVLQGGYPLPRHLTEPCRQLIRRILRPAPAERPTVAQIAGSGWLVLDAPPPPSPPLDPAHLAGPSQPPRGHEDEHEHEAEAEVRGALARLGVTEAHIRDNAGKDSRSPITGTYRIVQHRVQRGRGQGRGQGSPDTGPAAAAAPAMAMAMHRARGQDSRTRPDRAKLDGPLGLTSKLCSIL
ncbi:serine/threonine-protein kinase NIM1-like [Carcharodon carcharias]|uniref:serine/threonine-protein kinase NIM1-like n=1 Tax=Carcharodon carcharias TaxID=13397 RepID=UPI001B7E8A1F|nr:serine/threonine-protein kinase NIM1-like [Carcharodon carcharias]